MVVVQKCTRVSRPLREAPPRSSGVHHGLDRRGRHVPRVRGAVQPARPPAATARSGPPRPLRDLHGEQRSLPRDVRGRRAQRPVLHVRQLVPDRRGARLHRRQQRVEGAHHLGDEAAGRPRRARDVPKGDADARRRPARNRGRSTDRRLRHGHRRACRRRRSPTSARRADAVLVGHDRPAEGHHPPAPGATARASRCRCYALPQRTVALPGGHDLPVAGAALPLRAAGAPSA